MLLIRPDNLSVLDYEIAGSDIGQYILLGRLWRIGIWISAASWVGWFSHHVK
jgi:hypothetical protein